MHEDVRDVPGVDAIELEALRTAHGHCLIS